MTEEYRGIRYDDWVVRTEAREDTCRPGRRALLRAATFRPKISVIMPVFRPHLPFLAEAINSIRRQIYRNWELCIVEDGSKSEELDDLLGQFASEDPRIKVTVREHNGHICRASNDALTMCTGEMTGLLDHDDVLHPDGLFWVIRAMEAHRRARLIYTDEDKLDGCGARSDPHFKHSLDRHIILSQNFISHFGVYETAMIREIGGFRPGLEGSQDHDLALRALSILSDDEVVHIPRVLYHWRRWAGSTASNTAQKTYAHPASLRAVNDFLAQANEPVRARLSKIPGCLQVAPMRSSMPRTAKIVIRGEPRTSAELDATVELLSSLPATYRDVFADMPAAISAELAARLELARGPESIRVHTAPAKMDASLCPLPAEPEPSAAGAIIFVDAGVRGCVSQAWQHSADDHLTSSTWLEDPLTRLLAPEVGVVGGRILTSEGKVEQMGLALGPIGMVHHRFRGLEAWDPGYTGRAGIVQEVSAVGIDFMAIEGSLWRQLNGLTPDLSAWAGAIDFCLRARALGKKIIISPYATLKRAVPFDGRWSMGRSELLYLLRKHGPALRRDGRLSPNFMHRNSQLIIAPPDDLERYPAWARS